MQTILVIDDSKLVRDMLRGLLSQHQFYVDVAANASEGLHFLGYKPYDLVVVDYMLPDINGLQLLTTIKERFPELPVIMLTSKGNEGVAVQAMKLGASDYVIKSQDFIMQLPLIIQQAITSQAQKTVEEEKKPVPLQETVKTASQPKRILIVDDNDVMKNLTQQILQLNNFQTQTAKNGEECLEKILSMPDDFDLIIINFLLPDMNGLQLMEKLNKFKANIPFILLSSKGSEITAVKAMKLGAIDYIVKQPGYLEALPEMITASIQDPDKNKSKPHYQDSKEIKDHVLLISPSEDFSKRMEINIREAGYELISKCDTKKCLQELNLNDHDILIIKHSPPEIDAIQFLLDIRKKHTEPPVIILDSTWNSHNAVIALQQEATDYMTVTEDLSAILPLIIQRSLIKYQAVRKKENLEIEVQRKNELLNAKLKELKALNDIARHIVESLDLEKSLYNIVTKISELIHAQRISIMMVDEKNKHLTIRASKGFDEDDASQVKVLLGEKISGYVAQTGKSLFIPDIEKNPQFKKKNSPQYTHHSLICVPLISKNEIIGVINVSNKENSDTFTIEDFDTVSNFANYAAISIENSQQYMNVKTLTLIDDLTGCYNKRFYNDYIEKELERSYRYNRTMSLLMIDIDKFKDVNDTYGHYSGDLFLKEFCKLVVNSIRLPDMLIRYGGEEFIVILPDTSLDDACKFAERIRQTVEQTCLLPDIMQNKIVTVSIGAAEYKKKITSRELIENVDHALYEAKWKGRNKVCLFKQEEDKTTN